ncbi:NAD(P)H-dependent oxidoreductase subunit E [Motiliproteus sediminis]|uniref:NAD(P)H-dependent oxidoreductase subunit E n=1 Tax=Motiliproteus sediminis TaxID=1468178 RepID=UPI001AEF5A32|nr:NAD(P)H-dependent oxidoreductase subunit E [Motiliproteus sediminis]
MPELIASNRSSSRPRRGHRVDPVVREQLETLLDDSPLRRDRLLEYLHRIQDQHGHLPLSQLVALADLLQLAPAEVHEVASFYHHFELSEQTPALTLRVCESLSCHMAGADELVDALTAAFGDRLRIQPAPCVGRCAEAPVAVLGRHPVGNADVTAIQRALDANDREANLPEEYEDYLAFRSDNGYKLLSELASGARSADSVIAQLEDSGLRGLGGAGFPVGRKWLLVRQQPGPRLLAVNLDEGEPGTFKDRYYLERHPHRLLEGALIAATVVGCERIYLYLRDEYAGCRMLLEQELAALRASPPADLQLPEIELRRGAGAYICGEESAMLESIEGKRGMPRQRPPFVAEVGLFGRPTLVQNGESLYWVSELLRRGNDFFTREGRRGRHGLRSFSVSGRVRQPGVYLAPAGVSARELIDEYAGGMLPGHELQGYFPGGASGGILPANLADQPLDFDTLQPHGCFIGSAAVIVFSQQDSVRELALSALRFFAHESCGQCTPCRVGCARAVALMEQPAWDLENLQRLSRVMQDASICGLGQAAPNPLLCAMRYFPEAFSTVERTALAALDASEQEGAL